MSRKPRTLECRLSRDNLIMQDSDDETDGEGENNDNHSTYDNQTSIDSNSSSYGQTLESAQNVEV